MKKRILVLLFSISASAFAMDAPEITFEQLPAELKTQIISIGVQQAKPRKEMIDLIKKRSLVDKTFRKIIKDNAAQLINYFARKFAMTPYEVAFDFGALSKQWFIQKGLIQENEEISEGFLQAKRSEWNDLGKRLTDAISLVGTQSFELDQVTKLLNKGADPDYPNLEGRPQLMIAGDNLGLIEELLKAGANPNLRARNSGKTALFQPTSVEQVKLLLKYGADPTIKNFQGKTPLDYVESGRIEITKILEQAMLKQKLPKEQQFRQRERQPYGMEKSLFEERKRQPY